LKDPFGQPRSLTKIIPPYSRVHSFDQNFIQDAFYCKSPYLKSSLSFLDELESELDESYDPGQSRESHPSAFALQAVSLDASSLPFSSNHKFSSYLPSTRLSPLLLLKPKARCINELKTNPKMMDHGNSVIAVSQTFPDIEAAATVRIIPPAMISS
jgi:hypothetical protein